MISYDYLYKNSNGSSKYGSEYNLTYDGTIFEILGSTSDYNRLLIYYKNKCGWVDSKYIAINAKEYITSAEYNITNGTSAIYKSSGYDIAGLTGKKLYTDEYKNFVPITFPFARKLKVISDNIKSNGDTLVIYDAYRPYKVSTYANSKLTTLYNSNATVRNGINVSYGLSGTAYSWGKGWFLASGVSKHNTGCAVDVSLKGYTMPSNMHELSTTAIKYYSSVAPHTTKGFSKGVLNSTGAQKLHSYFMNSGQGLTDLSSEWWHYQDDTCHANIKAWASTGASFWSNV